MSGNNISFHATWRMSFLVSHRRSSADNVACLNIPPPPFPARLAVDIDRPFSSVTYIFLQWRFLPSPGPAACYQFNNSCMRYLTSLQSLLNALQFKLFSLV
jgi:hypothetical protein